MAEDNEEGHKAVDAAREGFERKGREHKVSSGTCERSARINVSNSSLRSSFDHTVRLDAGAAEHARGGPSNDGEG